MSILTMDHIVLTVTETDVSTAGSVFVVCPSDAKFVKAYSVIDGTIATAPAVITTEIDGVAVTNGSMSITHTDSAAGDVDSCTPSAANHISAGGVLEFITSGASTNTVSATYTAVFKLTTN